MGILKKLSGFFLPKNVDYFGNLTEQSKSTGQIVSALFDFYIDNPTKNSEEIIEKIAVAKKQRLANIIVLNKAFITPVDKEAISRVYSNLHWIDLSIKHLVIEMDTYGIFTLNDYTDILKILIKEMNFISEGFGKLNAKKFDAILTLVNHVINQDNLLIKAYAQQLDILFKKDDMHYIFPHREILLQLKEISKRIHFCANQLEDIVFKMN